MSKQKEIKKLAKEKNDSRNIVSQIEDYGISENQKIDIIFFLALTLNDNNALKDICQTVKKYKKNINIEEENANIKSSKLILE
jgi:RAB protein geranylgeranyltransferase component A